MSQEGNNINIQSKALWVIGLSLISLAVWGNSYFSEVGLLYRVLGFIGGTKNNPKSITDAEASRILNQIEHGIDESSQSVAFEPGEMIRVIDGPFNDFSGVVEEVDSEKSKVKVAVMIFGRSTPVELDFTQIERS